LKPIFAAQKVPEELVWVAEVESSFNPKARSPVGAAGLYQLMPPTAKRFGLKDSPDERLDPEASARAASKYFEYLHRRFKDWRLAMAAYNSGEGTVQKLLDRHKAKTFDEIATHLPAETQMYVPKIEATIAKREGVKLSQL
jgi:membrane-bound lytic murein transglycosylase D